MRSVVTGTDRFVLAASILTFKNAERKEGKTMTATRKIFRTAIITAVFWGVASAHTGTMGPINTYQEAIRLVCAGEISEALRTFWTAAEMFSCLNDLMTVIGLLSVAVHCASVLAFICKLFLCTPEHRDKDE